MDTKGKFYTIFAVDFDGTLSMGRFPELGDPNIPLFNRLIKEKEKGDFSPLLLSFLINCYYLHTAVI